jgi:lysophospholipase L1-like esterase
MNIKEKILLDRPGLEEHGAITIVAFGDSVTHGAVASGEINYETVYYNRLRQMINQRRSYMPVNVINSAIGGTTAAASVARMQRQVFDHHPDLVIVCFGLNDVNSTLETYLGALRTIFSRCIEEGVETIFLTPNMLNTRVAEDTPPQWLEYAHKTAEMQNSGRMDTYIFEAVRLANEMGVTVCDCYSKWKKLSETQDVTMLLANRINHPNAEMHHLFADSLYELIMKDPD